MFLSEGCIFCLNRKDHTESLETQCEFNRTVVKDLGRNFVDDMSDNLSRQFGFKSSSNHIDSVYCRITTFEGPRVFGAMEDNSPAASSSRAGQREQCDFFFFRQAEDENCKFWCKRKHLCLGPLKSINVLLKYRSKNCTKV